MSIVDLVSSRRRFFLFSLVLVVSSLVLLAIPPTLRPGIEFTAGTTTLLRFERNVDQADLRAAYADLDHAEARIQSTGDGEFLIRTSELEVPDTTLIEVSPDAIEPDVPAVELATLLLGADGAEGEVALRVFQFGAVCDFGGEIASFPAGTEALVLEEVRGCEELAPPADDAADGDSEEGDSDGGDSSGGDSADDDAAQPEETPSDGDEAQEQPADGEEQEEELIAYRVQVDGDGGLVTTGFIAPADTHNFLAPGEAPGEEPDAVSAPGGEDADLGERGLIEAELEARFGPFDVLEFASVSAVVSKRAVRNAAVAVVVASVFIMGYIVFAFSSMPHPMRYATAAIIALVHDVIIVLGAFSLFGKVFDTEINLMFVTGVLTIIGFSVHDTIVIFDRVRENVRLAPAAPFAENVNAALVQSLGRSLNTSVTLLFTILALLWLGGTTIQSFLLVLLVGVVAGAYSSIAIAAQVLVAWAEGDVPRLFGRLRRRRREEEAPAT